MSEMSGWSDREVVVTYQRAKRAAQDGQSYGLGSFGVRRLWGIAATYHNEIYRRKQERAARQQVPLRSKTRQIGEEQGGGWLLPG